MIVLLRVTVIAVVCLVCLVQHGDKASASELDEIIEAVVANESLYKNLEVNSTIEYSLEKPPTVKTDHDVILRQKSATHFVTQDAMFRSTESSETTTNLRKDVSSTERVSAFDGEKVRRRENSVVNIIHDSTTSETGLVRPHEYIFSLYLRGGALSDRLRGLDINGYHTNTVYEGEDTLDDGTKCLKLRIEKWEDGPGERDYWLVWLRPDRNYLPAKGVGHAVGYSREIPLEVATVEDWTEVEKGIWLPASIRRVINAEIAASEGRTVVSNVQMDEFTNWSINPQYDKSFFTEFEIPRDALVYEIRNGKIFNKYDLADGTKSIGATSWSNRRIGLTLLSVVIIAAAVIFAIWRHRDAGQPVGA